MWDERPCCVPGSARCLPVPVCVCLISSGKLLLSCALAPIWVVVRGALSVETGFILALPLIISSLHVSASPPTGLVTPSLPSSLRLNVFALGFPRSTRFRLTGDSLRPDGIQFFADGKTFTDTTVKHPTAASYVSLAAQKANHCIDLGAAAKHDKYDGLAHDQQARLYPLVRDIREYGQGVQRLPHSCD